MRNEPKSGENVQNDVGTCQQIDTRLTRERSGFDLENMRRFLIAERGAAGAVSPIGHRCSNLIEQLEAYSRATDPAQRDNLQCSITMSVMEIRDLKRRRETQALSKPALRLAFSANAYQ